MHHLESHAALRRRSMRPEATFLTSFLLFLCQTKDAIPNRNTLTQQRHLVFVSYLQIQQIAHHYNQAHDDDQEHLLPIPLSSHIKHANNVLRWVEWILINPLTRYLQVFS